MALNKGGGDRLWRLLDRVLSVLAVAALGVLLFVGLMPGGPIRQFYQQWVTRREVVRVLDREWERLATSPARLDESLGPAVVVEFSDYQCPYCKQEHFVLERDSGESKRIGIAFRHLPNPLHPAARGAALSAICARRAGAFLAVHRVLFETMEWQSDTNWVGVAVAAGLKDTVAFKACLGSALASAEVDSDVALARRLGIGQTPSFVGRKEVIAGTVMPSALVRLGIQASHGE